jgi:hypothetical protein
LSALALNEQWLIAVGYHYNSKKTLFYNDIKGRQHKGGYSIPNEVHQWLWQLEGSAG